MPRRPLAAIQKAFTEVVEQTAYAKDRGSVFSDWAEIAALSLHQLPYHAGHLPQDKNFERCEQSYLALVKNYAREDLDRFGRLLALTTEALTLYPGDFLGETYGSLGLQNQRAGQIFTPFPVSQAIAKMQMGNLAEQIKDKSIITISDPACGAGGMLIAAALEVKQQQYDPRSVVQFHAADISRTCFNMTYIQLALCDLQAVVQHGNSLSGEIWESRPTPQMRLFQDWLNHQSLQQKAQRLLDIIRQAEASAPAPPPPPQPAADITFTPRQLNLFDTKEYES